MAVGGIRRGRGVSSCVTAPELGLGFERVRGRDGGSGGVMKMIGGLR